MKHDYWGDIHPSWAGFSSETFFSHCFFNQNADREIFLGKSLMKMAKRSKKHPILINSTLLQKPTNYLSTVLNNIFRPFNNMLLNAIKSFMHIIMKIQKNPVRLH